MKTYFYTTEEKHDKTKVQRDVKMSIFECRNNKPVLIASTSFNTGSCKGYQNEAMAALKSIGEIPENIDFNDEDLNAEYKKGYYNMGMKNKLEIMGL